MVVTNNKLNPFVDASKVLDAIAHNPNWPEVYKRVASGYNEEYMRVLDMAINEESRHRGWNSQKVSLGLASVLDECKSQRLTMGEKIRVSVEGQEEIVGSAVAQNTYGNFKEFAETHVGEHQAKGFEIGQIGNADEGSLDTSYETDALGALDMICGMGASSVATEGIDLSKKE